ncbi:MAG: hypothetical protein IGQ45_14665 [Cyanobacterium sp. T60_A2020_053]|nr:hypothetical protein [Cyanobacterium sp. T60_A2020_053]
MTINLSENKVCLDDYCVFGIATCYWRDGNEIKEIEVIEPIPSAYLETMMRGVETSYRFACAKTVGEILVNDNLQKPSEFPSQSQFCDNFQEIMLAATRTYKHKPSARHHIPLGQQKADFNYSVARKRIINNVKVVSDDDNVKQHSHTHKIL